MEDSISPSRPRGPVLVIMASVVGALVVGAAVGVVVTKKLNSSGAPVVNAPEVPVDAGQVPTTPSVPVVESEPKVPVVLLPAPALQLSHKDILEISWLSLPKKVSGENVAALLGIPVEKIITTAQDDFGSASFYEVGSVKIGQRYAGSQVFVLDIPFVGMGSGNVRMRLIADAKNHRFVNITSYGEAVSVVRPSSEYPDDNSYPAWRVTEVVDESPLIKLAGMDLPQQVTLVGSRYTFTQLARNPGFGLSQQRDSLILDTSAVVVGATTDGRKLYQGGQANCFFLLRPDGSYIVYRIDMPFAATSVIQATWTNGIQNKDDFDWTDEGGCGSRNCYAIRAETDVQSSKRLKVVGKTSNNEPLYGITDINDAEFKKFYSENIQPYIEYRRQNNKTVPSVEEVFADHPIVYWKNPLEQWVRMTKKKYAPMAECGKPVVYLYPEKTISARVSVGLKGEMTKSEPEHGKTGWSVVAQPDGYVINKADGKTYPNLFWEGTGVDYKTPTQGFVIKGAETDAWLTKTLATIGFTERESAEFREFWVPRMPKTPYVFVTFVPQAYFDRDAPLRITPRPDNVFRVFMEYRGLDTELSVEPLMLPKITREGFTVVEWGGSLRK